MTGLNRKTGSKRHRQLFSISTEVIHTAVHFSLHNKNYSLKTDLLFPTSLNAHVCNMAEAAILQLYFVPVLKLPKLFLA